MMLKTGDVSRVLGVSSNTVRRLVETGDLACSVMPSGLRLFEEDDVSAFQREKVIRYSGVASTESGINQAQCEQLDVIIGDSHLQSENLKGGINRYV